MNLYDLAKIAVEAINKVQDVEGMQPTVALRLPASKKKSHERRLIAPKAPKGIVVETGKEYDTVVFNALAILVWLQDMGVVEFEKTQETKLEP